MKKTILIVGNWKMNKNPHETHEFLDRFKVSLKAAQAKISPDIHYGIAAPFISLEALKSKAPAQLHVVAQNAHFQDSGAFTGEVSMPMLKSIGVSHVIIGHSERRAMFSETDITVNAKLLAAFKHNLTPILCVGESLADYQAHNTEKVLRAQLEAALKNLTPAQKQQLVVAYEPIWAIGTGMSATPQVAEAACAFIRQFVTPTTIIQYGGSVKPETIAELMSQKNINGALVGNASLDPESFTKLLTLGK